MAKTKITWFGHGSMMAEWDDKIVYMDPWIVDNPKCDLKLEDIKKATAVLVTHGHNDHLGNAFEICKQTGGILICSPEIALYANQKGLEWDKDSYALNTGGSWAGDGFTVTMTQAAHTSDILGEEFQKSGTIEAGSGCAGFIIDIDDGPTIYFSGDTDVFGDMALIKEMFAPDVALVSCGGRFTMTYKGAAIAADLLAPKYFIPMHFNTFPFNEMDRDKLEAEMATRAPKVKLVRIDQMESFEC